MRITTGFHAIEEELKALEDQPGKKDGMSILYSKPGPRVKKIIQTAQQLGIPCLETDEKNLNSRVASLPPTARDHRGILLVAEKESGAAPLTLDAALADLASKSSATVVILDSITDPHNVGAIIRSADQFGINLVLIPEHRGATDFEVISRTSAGASSWVNIVIIPNLVRAVERLKESGFWVYGADAGGKPAHELSCPDKTALIMGSEGAGIARLLKEKCDDIISIPTKGKLDSLNVSVAAGILLYELTGPKRNQTR